MCPKGIGDVVGRQQILHRAVGATCGNGSHVRFGPCSRVEARAGLQGCERTSVRPQRGDGVRVGLQRQHLVGVRCRRLAESVGQSHIHLAGGDLHPRLVQSPRGVHLDVRFVDRRNGPDRVDRGDERESAPGKVIRGPRAPEVDVGAGDTQFGVELLKTGHQHLDAVGGAECLVDVWTVRESDHCDRRHVAVCAAHRWSLYES